MKEEVAMVTSDLGQEWEKDIFTGLINSLETTEYLFKYKMLNIKDYRLKIMTSTFAGSFSEYFIHDLCREFHDCGKIDALTPQKFKILLESVISTDKDDIKLNDVLVAGKPDIDLHIKNKCAVFLKNRKLQYDRMKTIQEEIELCREKKIGKVFYGINFIKNVEKIDEIRKFLEKAKTEYPSVSIGVFDIKDLIHVLLDELKRTGKSRLNFSKFELDKVLDY